MSRTTDDELEMLAEKMDQAADEGAPEQWLSDEDCRFAAVLLRGFTAEGRILRALLARAGGALAEALLASGAEVDSSPVLAEIREALRA